MTPINFKEANKDLLKPQGMTDAECGSLRVFSDGNQCISCWKMSFKERLYALFFGKVWLGVVSGQTQPPVYLLGKFPFEKTSLRQRFHERYYKNIYSANKYVAWWYLFLVWGHGFLPFYMDIPFSRYQLAAWNCGNGWKDLRITIKESESGQWMFTIKRGDYEDPKRCSIYFRPFGLALHMMFNQAKKVTQ